MVYPIFLPHIPVFLLPQTHENLQSKPKSTNNHQIFLSTPCFIPKFFTTFASAFRDVAQPGRVHVWGACCRRFKSCHPDKMMIKHLQFKKEVLFSSSLKESLHFKRKLTRIKEKREVIPRHEFGTRRRFPSSFSSTRRETCKGEKGLLVYLVIAPGLSIVEIAPFPRRYAIFPPPPLFSNLPCSLT